MSAPGVVKREEETDGVYELSSSSTNSDDGNREGEGEEVGKRVSPSESAWGGGFLQKKQKLEPVDDLRLNAWRYEDLKKQTQKDEVKVASPVALPFFPQPSLEDSARTRSSCKQFWKAGDYEGPPAVAMQKGGDYSYSFAWVLLVRHWCVQMRVVLLTIESVSV